MSTLDQSQHFLLRAQQEERAAQRATCVEARLSHQRLAARLRRLVTQFGRAPDDPR